MADFEIEEQATIEENPALDITEYLLSNQDIRSETAEVYPGDRFILNKLPFTIRVITDTEFDQWSKICTKTKTVKGKRTTDFDSTKFNELACVNCTLKPNFKDAASIGRAGVHTPEQFLNKVLLPGEVTGLATEISSFSGFDRTLEEEKDELKNG